MKNPLPTRMAAALACTLLLAGCENMGQQFGKALTDAMKADTAAQAAAGGGAPRAANAPVRNGVRSSAELNDIFKKNPISNSRKPETWPRVAITIKSATAGVFNLSGQGSLRDNDCVVFDVRLWNSASDGRRFDNLELCVEAVQKEAKGVAFRTLDLLPRFTFPATENTTAARRTDGPVPPFHMFPQDIQSMQTWPMGHQNTRFFLGSILLSLGYDWDNDFDRRVWFVTVPKAPGS